MNNSEKNSEKREAINKIKQNNELTQAEKNIQIQKIMMGNYADLKPDLKPNLSKSCSHYVKSCYKFYFDCCNTYDPCKRCHLERESCSSLTSTKQNIPSLKTIECIDCSTEQEPSNTCVNPDCQIQFAPNYCGICKIWTQKSITHCELCGICRIGTPDTLFHCVTCGICFMVGSTHTCKSNYKQAICSICTDQIFNSQSNSVQFENCIHMAHSNCFHQYIGQNNYRCPCCKKSVVNMKTQWTYLCELIKNNPMPMDMIPINLLDVVESKWGKFKVLDINNLNNKKMYSGEFIEWTNNNKTNVFGTLNQDSIIKILYKNIYCNDCENKSTRPFHFYGIECGFCKGFNTQE